MSWAHLQAEVAADGPVLAGLRRPRVDSIQMLADKHAEGLLAVADHVEPLVWGHARDRLIAEAATAADPYIRIAEGLMRRG